MSAIEERLRTIVAETADADPREVHAGAHLVTDLAVDSLDRVTIATVIEGELDIEIADEAIEGWTYFGDVVAFVQKAVA